MMSLVLFLLCLGVTSVQGNYEYAAVCMPPARPSYTAVCTMYFTSATDTDIEIHTATGTIYTNLNAGVTHLRSFGSEFIPVFGSNPVSSIGVFVVSPVPIQILVAKTGLQYAWYDDAYMVSERTDAGSRYFTTAYEGPGVDGCTSPLPYRQFILVTSFFNETTVSVTTAQNNAEVKHYELPAFGTLFLTTYSTNDYLANGAYINSTGPVNVVSGNGCVAANTAYGQLATNILPEASLGTEYIVPETISNASTSGGYYISIVATEDDTIVTSIYTGSITLSRGETIYENYVGVSSSVLVTCSKKCLVAQYSAGVDYQPAGIFMQQVLPLSAFTTTAVFSTLSDKPTGFMSIVLRGETPGDDLYLDGQSLGSENWTAISGYTYATIRLDAGVYELESMDGRPFAAYIYRHLGTPGVGASGYGYVSSGATEPTSPPTPTPTTTLTPAPTTTSAPSRELPLHTARSNGTARTEDTSDITPACAVEHLNALDAKTKTMILEVNEAIGESICLGVPGVRAVTGRALMFNQGNQALLAIDQTLQVQPGNLIGEVESCAVEVAEYINDLSHWPQPIFPDQAGCSRLVVQPYYFNTSSTFWNCDNQHEVSQADNHLSYESRMGEVLSTRDGSSLDFPCVVAYTDESGRKAGAMQQAIEEELAVSGCADAVAAVSHTSSFSSLADQAYFVASFFYLPQPSARFGEFAACMELAHDFALRHANWSPGSQPGAPFLPVPPGCPPMDHEGDILDDEGQRWTCV